MPAKNLSAAFAKRLWIFTLAALLLAAGGCSYFRLPVLQGNVVEPKKAEQLELGMTPSQVKFLLGTPLIQETFGRPRWDYVVYYRDPGNEVYHKHLSIFFEDEKVAKIEGMEDLVEARRKQQEAKDKAAAQIQPQRDEE